MNPTGDFIIQFQYRHAFEVSSNVPYDGGVLEVTDDGVHWYDLYLDLGLNPGYSVFLPVGGGNPLEDRAAFAGVSTNYPAFVTRQVNFKTMLAGATVKFRFRTGSDEGTAADGMDIDNFVVANATTAPFTGLVAESATPSCNARPTAMVGQLVDIYTPTVKEATIGDRPTRQVHPDRGRPSTARAASIPRAPR